MFGCSFLRASQMMIPKGIPTKTNKTIIPIKYIISTSIDKIQAG